MSTQECVFCKIAKKQLPAKIVYENENFIAFLDINPVSKGHTLVIPKKHVTDFAGLVEEDKEFVYNYLLAVEETRKVLEKKYKPYGIRIGINTGSLIEVHHLHTHLVPVYK